jgi:hypothetical protein
MDTHLTCAVAEPDPHLFDPAGSDRDPHWNIGTDSVVEYAL